MNFFSKYLKSKFIFTKPKKAIKISSNIVKYDKNNLSNEKLLKKIFKKDFNHLFNVKVLNGNQRK